LQTQGETLTLQDKMNPFAYIKKPCHESWDSMQGEEKRRFCEKCTTHVHDLTNLKHEEIVALKVKNGGTLCGSFRLPFISRPLTIGTGIASLALASCDQEKPVTNEDQAPFKVVEAVPGLNKDRVILGEVGEPISGPNKDQVIMGIVCEEPPKKPKSEEPKSEEPKKVPRTLQRTDR
jgi:hypothetical protein